MKKLLMLLVVLVLAAACCSANAEELLQLVTVTSGGCTISVNVFEDKNKNGAKGKSEPLFADAQLELYSVQNGAEQFVSRKTSSGNDAVVFDCLPAGTYRIKVTLPEGWGFSKNARKLTSTNNMMTASTEREQVSPNLTIDEEDEMLECGIGVTGMSGYAGTVWLDADGDGIRDADDHGVSGMTITMTGTKNGLTYTATTEADGSFAFTQLKPGGYNVTMTLTDGYIFTRGGSVFTDAGETSGKKYVDLNGGVTVNDQQIGITLSSEIVVTCFVDNNYNGLHDADEGLVKGMRVELLRGDSKTVIKSATTGDDGSVTFSGLICDTYRVRTTLSGKEYDFTRVVEGGNVFEDDGDANAVASGLVLVPDETLLIEAGIVKTGSVSGFIFYDDDYSGTYDKKKEKVAAYIRVNLVDQEGNVAGTVKCDETGSFTISDVYPGWYRLSVEPKTGYAFTMYGNSSIVSYHDGAGYSEPFYLSLSEKKTGMIAPMMIPATVSGSVWCDWNDNGTQDNKEGGLWNATVTLIRDDGVEAELTPATSGRYVFGSVAPGRYRIEIQLSDYARFAGDIDGTLFTLSGDGSTASTNWFNVAAKSKYSAPSIGGVSLTPVNGSVFLDANADGLADSTDQPVAGLRLTVTDADGNILRSAVSDSDGRFSMDPICTGTYTLTISTPDGYMLSRLNDTIKIPAAPSMQDESVQIQIGIGDNWSNQQIGLVKPCTLTGSVWMDENGNGSPDATEGGPAGRCFTLINTETGEEYRTLVSDENGVFSASDLLPGSYLIVYRCDGFETIITGNDTTFVPYGEDAWCYGPVVLADGNTVTGLKLGMTSTTSVAGHAWEDVNGSYVALPGMTVRLMDGNGSVLATAITDENGAYAFNGLAPGNYCLDAYVPSDRFMTASDDWRSVSGEGISVMRYTSGNYGRSDVFTVRMGRHLLKQDFGAVTYGALGDLCWLDLNGNGLQETEEGGIPGITIQLLDDGVVIAETVTDQYGYYRFDQLYPGEYVLHVIYPAEVVPTAPRSDVYGAISVMQEDSIDSFKVRVVSNGHNYNADLGFKLVRNGVYPAGYGEGDAQNWKFKK